MPPAHTPRHRIGQSYAGFEPPQSLLAERAVFGPQGELDCLSCHRLHDASGAWPLLIRANPDSALCLDCHPQTRSLLDSSHDLRHTAPTTRNARGQTAAQSGPCGACHRIHGWARDLAELPLTYGSGCVECHTKEGPGSDEHGYRAVHPIGIVRSEDKAIPSALDAAGQTITCLTCHDPHTPCPPRPDGLGLESRRAGESAAFLRIPSSNLCPLCHEDKADMAQTVHDLRSISADSRPDLPATGLCLNCHQVHGSPGAAQACVRCHKDQQAMQGSVHDFDMGSGLDSMAYAAGGLCVDCHPIHGAPEDSLLSALDHPPDQPIDCESCHRQDGVAHEMRGLHLGKVLAHDPNSLAGTLALGPDRKLVCQTCHDIHQGGVADKLLRAGREDSRLCRVCHLKEMALINSPHDLRRSAPYLHNRQDESAYQSGPCGACHRIHPMSQSHDGWAQVGETTSNFAGGLCTGCHKESDRAVAGLPQQLHHPDISLYNRSVKGSAEYMPTFDRQGRPSPTGTITCLTCHDPHASGQTSQGTVSSLHFLRRASGQSLCRDCHGPEALWRYLYFHREIRNPRPQGQWLTPR